MKSVISQLGVVESWRQLYMGSSAIGESALIELMPTE